jgi:hypothetical protein
MLKADGELKNLLKAKEIDQIFTGARNIKNVKQILRNIL